LLKLTWFRALAASLAVSLVQVRRAARIQRKVQKTANLKVTKQQKSYLQKPGPPKTGNLNET